jgi:hypothetical protein
VRSTLPFRFCPNRLNWRFYYEVSEIFPAKRIKRLSTYQVNEEWFLSKSAIGLMGSLEAEPPKPNKLLKFYDLSSKARAVFKNLIFGKRER